MYLHRDSLMHQLLLDSGSSPGAAAGDLNPEESPVIQRLRRFQEEQKANRSSAGYSTGGADPAHFLQRLLLATGCMTSQPPPKLISRKL